MSAHGGQVLVNARVIEKAPKSQRGYRTPPLDPSLVAALGALRDQQVTEAMETGEEAYEDSGYVVADELGCPVNAERSPRGSIWCASAPAGTPAAAISELIVCLASCKRTRGRPLHSKP